MKKPNFIKLFTVSLCLVFVFFLVQCADNPEKTKWQNNYNLPKISVTKAEKQIALENALYTAQDFFGTQAIVPFPTAKARENLNEVLQKYPNDAEILQTAAEFNEKLEKFDLAEQELKNPIEAEKENQAHYEKLAAFYGRRGEFVKQAETLD